MIPREWLVAHFTLFRIALFLCSLGYCLVGYFWFKPKGREFPQSVMAVWTQMSIGNLMDGAVISMGYWAYWPMPFSLRGIPLDLHLDWGLIWGFFLVWLYSKLRRYWRGPLFVLIYLSIWTLVTVLFDAAVARQMLFLSGADPHWWVADIVFLFVVQSITLMVYHTGLFPSPRPFWRSLACRIRSVLYVGTLAYVFYGYLPRLVLSLTHQENIRPLLDMRNPLLFCALAALPIALGTWATLAFTDIGFGTPLPLDPPRRLITTGPYAYVRNPMQIAGMLLALLLPLQYPSPYIWFYLLDMGLVSIVLFKIFEQGELEDRFTKEYALYSEAVRNWIPRRAPYHP